MADTTFAVTPEVQIGAPVPNAGTITFPYPTGYSQGSAWGGGNHVLADSQANVYTSGFTVSFGSSTITLTNTSLGTLLAGRKFRLQCNLFGTGGAADGETGIVTGLSTANTAAAATTNVTAIQAALTAGGLVQITTPGTYYINATLVCYRDTEIYLGPGVVVRQYAGTNKSMLRNSQYATANVTAGSTITTATTGLSGNLLATVTCAGLGVVAGDYVFITGDTSGGVGGTYNGLHLVDGYADPTLTFKVKGTTTLSASSGTVKIVKADGNITLRGPGVWDYNNVNNPGASGNDLHMIIFNQCGKIRLLNCEFRNSAKYCFYAGSYDGIRADGTNLLTGSDGLHFLGPGYNTQVNGMQGESGDDIVAFTTANGTEYSSYDLTNCDGNFYNIEINNIQELQGTNHRAVLIEAVEGYGFYGVKIDGVQCLHTGYIAVMMTARNTYSGFINDIDIKNVSGGYGIAAIAPVLVAGPSASGLLTVGTVSINGVYPSSPNSGAAMISSTGRVTGNQLKIFNLVQRPLSLKSGIVVTGANVTWNQIIVEKSRGDFDATNAAVNLQLGQFESGTFKHIVMRDCYVTTNAGTTQPCQIATLFAPATTTRIDIENCYHDGYTYAFKPNSITNIPTVRLSGTKSAGLFVISGSDSYNLDVNDIEIISCSGGTAFNTGATSKTFGIFVRGIRNTGAVTLFNYGTTNTFNVTGSDGTLSLKTDTAGHTFNISAGAILRDTQAAAPGLYAQGITTYTRLTA